MIAAVMLMLAMQGQVVVKGGPPPKPVPLDAPTSLPDTPQGKRVKAYVEAFNTGDEQQFLKAQEQMTAPDVLSRRTPEQRAQMYTRMRGDFGTLQIRRVAASPDQIRVVVPDKDGNEAIMVFDFEARAPYRITGIGIDITKQGGPGLP